MSKLGGRNIEADARRLRVLLTAGGHIYKTKVSSDDTTPGFLSDKIASADASVVITVANDGADEDLDLSVAVYVAAEIEDHADDPDAHHAQVHVLATTAGLGADHAVSGLTAGQVLRATSSTTAAFASLQATDLPTHVIATNVGLGSQHSISGATAGHVLRASGATAAAFAQLQHSDLGGVTADQHHNQSHVLATTSALGADHTVSGLTSGQVLRATGATTAAFGSLVATDLPSHVLATNTALGSQHTISGATAGHVLRASGATAAAFAQLQHSDLGGVGANDHHNQQHTLVGSDHTATGLTAGHVLRATGATTFAFAAIQATDLPNHVLATTAGLGGQHTVSGLTAGQVLRATGASTAAFASLQATDLPSHVLATNAGLGSQHTISGATAGHVLRASGATAAAFAQLQHSDLGGVGANDHHNQSHVLASTSGLGADHTVSGLTARQVLVATGATTALFRAIQAADLPTGATLSVSSTNSGDSHAITSSSAVSSATAVILATDANGRLQVQGVGVGTAATGTGVLDVSSKIYINETAEANVTTGLVINQGTADNAIISLKSSEVSHGMTDIAETDTYGYIGKAGNGDAATGFDAGGLLVLGMRDADANANRALVLAGYLGEAAETSTSMGNGGSLGVVQITAAVKSAANVAAVADGGNMLAVLNYGNTNLLMKGNGDLYKRGELLLTDDDVAHGITDVAISSAYARLYPFSGTEGGAIYAGLSESTSAVGVFGIATSESTTKATTAQGAIEMRSYLKSGTTVTTLGANANLAIIRNGTTTRWIVDTEGDTHRDGSDNTYDTYHDAHLARAFDRAVSPGSVVDSDFDQWVQYGRDDLIAAGILHESGFYNESRLLRLAIGAVWQEYTERQRLALRVRELEQRLLN